MLHESVAGYSDPALFRTQIFKHPVPACGLQVYRQIETTEKGTNSDIHKGMTLSRKGVITSFSGCSGNDILHIKSQ
jgi:hypothetical protein